MKIVMPYHVHEKIMHWVDKCGFEVSGFGKVSWIPDTKEFFVHDVYLIKQEGGAAHTDIDAESLSSMMGKLFRQPGMLSFWWHSHVHMDAFMSGQDKATIRELGGNGWCVAAVFNKKWEYQTAVSYKYSTEFDKDFTHYEEGIELEIRNPSISEDTKKLWDSEYDENVKEKKYTPTGYSGGYHGNYGYGSGRTYESAEEFQARWNERLAHQRSLLTGDEGEDTFPAASRVIDMTKTAGDLVDDLDDDEEPSWRDDIYTAEDDMSRILNPRDPVIVEEARLMGMKPKKYVKYVARLNATQLEEHYERLDQRYADVYGKQWAPGRQ